AHVGFNLARAVEQGGVTARARRERLDVVGDLPLQELGRLAAADDDPRQVGALDHPRFLAQRAVLGVEFESRLHARDCRRRPQCANKFDVPNLWTCSAYTSAPPPGPAPDPLAAPGTHGRDRRASATEAIEDYAKAIHALAAREP